MTRNEQTSSDLSTWLCVY